MKKKVIISCLFILLLAGIFFFIINFNKIKETDYYVIKEIAYKEEKAYYYDIYNWYKEMENKNGVYLINTSYQSKELLKEWKKEKVYENIPLKDYWYFIVSPNYLQEKMKININDSVIQKAKDGVRVYLIPDTYTKKEVEQMKLFLQESDNEAINGEAPVKPEETVNTVYYEQPKSEFISYSPNKNNFTFPTDIEENIKEKAPIILITTTNNMIYFESESLSATGINSYIKFEDEKILNQYKDSKYLKDKKTLFTKISKEYKIAEEDEMVKKGVVSVFK